jgi:hypothetical protein
VSWGALEPVAFYGSQNTFTPSSDQWENARTIVQVAEERGMPLYAAVVAVATSIQESQLINLTTATNADSVGLFQQRPSQGWGTPEQVQDPVYAAGRFYDHLVQVPDWETGRLTDISQSVQRSAFPGAYQKHEAMAVELAADVSSGNLPC